MMESELKTLTIKGKTVDEAIANGLREMGLSIDEVTIEILQDGGRGFLGFGKNAMVKLTQKETDGGAEAFLKKLFSYMNVDANAIIEENNGVLNIELTGDSTGVLIGRRGETLDAIQYLTSLVINKGAESYTRVLIDTENYRKKREETLIKLANRIAGKVARTGKRVVLEPMNPYERRVLHAALQNNNKVETVSEGEDPYRRVIIKKKRY